MIDNWTVHGATTDTGAVNMVTGQRYPITIEYFQAGGPGTIALNWQPAGATSMVSIPSSRLYPSTAPSTTNLAIGKSATQASDWSSSSVAKLAVDGNTDGSFSNGSVSHTAGGFQDWWQVDLASQSRIDLIQIWNRTDCCSDRLTNFVVYVAPYDMSAKTPSQLAADPAVMQFKIGANTSVNPVIGIPVYGVGRYVKIQLLGTNFLHLAEVQVFGAASVNSGTSTALTRTRPDILNQAAWSMTAFLARHRILDRADRSYDKEPWLKETRYYKTTALSASAT